MDIKAEEATTLLAGVATHGSWGSAAPTDAPTDPDSIAASDVGPNGSSHQGDDAGHGGELEEELELEEDLAEGEEGEDEGEDEGESDSESESESDSDDSGDDGTSTDSGGLSAGAASPGTRQSAWFPEVGLECDAQDKKGFWAKAKIVEVDRSPDGTRVRVSFKGFKSIHDEWIDASGPRIAELGSQTEPKPPSPPAAVRSEPPPSRPRPQLKRKKNAAGGAEKQKKGKRAKTQGQPAAIPAWQEAGVAGGVRERWKDLVVRCARELKRSEKNTEKLYVVKGALTLQLETLGAKDTATVLRIASQQPPTDADRTEVSRLMAAAVSGLGSQGGKTSGAKAALNAVAQALGDSDGKPAGVSSPKRPRKPTEHYEAGPASGKRTSHAGGASTQQEGATRSAPKKKKAKTKVKKPPKASSYAMFIKETKEEYSHLAFSERSKAWSARWSSMSAEEKRPYEEQAEAADAGEPAQPQPKPTKPAAKPAARPAARPAAKAAAKPAKSQSGEDGELVELKRRYKELYKKPAMGHAAKKKEWLRAKIAEKEKEGAAAASLDATRPNAELWSVASAESSAPPAAATAVRTEAHRELQEWLYAQHIFAPAVCEAFISEGFESVEDLLAAALTEGDIKEFGWDLKNRKRVLYALNHAQRAKAAGAGILHSPPVTAPAPATTSAPTRPPPLPAVERPEELPSGALLEAREPRPTRDDARKLLAARSPHRPECGHETESRRRPYEPPDPEPPFVRRYDPVWAAPEETRPYWRTVPAAPRTPRLMSKELWQAFWELTVHDLRRPSRATEIEEGIPSSRPVNSRRDSVVRTLRYEAGGWVRYGNSNSEIRAFAEQFARNCLLARAAKTEEDARFCAQFMLLMQEVHSQNLILLLIDSLVKAVSQAVDECRGPAEAKNIGRLLQLTLENVGRWRTDSSAFTEEAHPPAEVTHAKFVETSQQWFDRLRRELGSGAAFGVANHKSSVLNACAALIAKFGSQGASAAAARPLAEPPAASRAPPPQPQSERHGGVVKAWRDEGFGFITRTNDGKEFFCHRRELPDPALGQLVPGSRVEFTVSAGRHGTMHDEAARVTVVAEAPRQTAVPPAQPQAIAPPARPHAAPQSTRPDAVDLTSGSCSPVPAGAATGQGPGAPQHGAPNLGAPSELTSQPLAHRPAQAVVQQQQPQVLLDLGPKPARTDAFRLFLYKRSAPRPFELAWLCLERLKEPFPVPPLLVAHKEQTIPLSHFPELTLGSLPSCRVWTEGARGQREWPKLKSNLLREGSPQEMAVVLSPGLADRLRLTNGCAEEFRGHYYLTKDRLFFASAGAPHKKHLDLQKRA